MAELPTKDGQISMANIEDLTTEDETCKICYVGNEETGNPLITPCLCAGSMRHVHNDCLVRWIETAALERCDLCREVFNSPVSCLNLRFSVAFCRNC